MTNNQRIVITGIGPISSIGIGKDELWKSVKSEKTNVINQNFYDDGTLLDTFYLHKVENFDRKMFDLDEKTLEWIREWKNGREDMDLMYLAAVGQLALKDSGLKYDPEHNDVGIVAVHENPGLEILFKEIFRHSFNVMKDSKELLKSDVMRSVFNKCERTGYDTQTFMYLYFLGKLFSTHGYSLFINNACASGLFAIESASQLIKSGKCSAVVIVGADRQSEVYKHWWLNGLAIYSKDGLIKPFSSKRSGFVLGEGGAGLVLEDLNRAEKRGAHIYAEYLGGGFNLEGGKVSLPSVDKNYYSDCMAAALKESKTSAQDIDVVNAHGVGTGITDLHEARSISRIFGEGAGSCLVNAFKPFFGHNLGSSALLESALLLLSMKNNYVPASLNCEPIDPQVKINLSVKSVEKDVKKVMKLSCGFAGYNGAVVFKKHS